MNGKTRYKWCFVPKCKNTTIKTPTKLFFPVPKNNELRKQWFQSARRIDEPGLCSYY